MYTLVDLKKSILDGNDHSYVYFWGPLGRTGYMSQSYESSPFSVDGITYATVDHWVMASKAKLFGDLVSEKLIINTKYTRDIKDLGQVIKNFDSDIWDRNSYDIVVQGNLAKFSQNANIKKLLLKTRDSILVDASPYDKDWGIGLHRTDKDSSNPNLWKGKNKLGFALMDVRSKLSKM